MYYRKSKRRKRRSMKKLIFSIIGIAVILLLVVLLGRMNLRTQRQRIALEEKINNLQEQCENLEEKKDKLIEQIEETNNVAYLERIAKEELNLKRPEEKAVSFFSQDDVSTTEEEPVKQGFWGKLLWRLKTWFH